MWQISDVLIEKLYEPFNVSRPTREFILAKRVYHDCPIFINHKDTTTNLIDLYILDFDIILGMNWLRTCYVSIDCRIRVV